MAPWPLLVGVALAVDPASEAASRLGVALSEDGRIEWRGRTRVRLVQRAAGLPVLGRGAAAELRPDGRLSWLARRVARGLAPEPPALPVAEAEAAALALRPGARVAWSRAVVVPDGRGWPAWEVHLRGPRPEHSVRVLVDARDGRVRRLLPDRLTDRLGRTYARYPEDGDLEVTELPGLDAGAEVLEGDAVTAWNRTWTTGDEFEEVHAAVADDEGDFLYEPEEGALDDPFAEVNAYRHARDAWAWFAGRFGHDVPDSVEVRVNYRAARDTAFDNAYFQYADAAGDYLLTFGQGEVVDWAYDPTVIVHEFGHGIVEDVAHVLEGSGYPVNLDEYGLHPAPGGLAEGLPDYFAASRFDRSDMAALEDGTPIRDLDNDARCPGSVLGEAHADGEVVGGATWSIREAVGADVADAIVYGSLSRLPPSPTYAEFAEALLAEAAALEEDGAAPAGTADAVRGVLEERGLLDCGRAVPLVPGETERTTFIGADIFDADLCEFARNLGVRITPPFQFTTTIPEDPDGRVAEGLRWTMETTAAYGGVPSEDDLDWRADVARDGLVHFVTDELEVLGYVFELPQESDNAVASFDGAPTSWTLEAADLGLDALPAGSAWTVALSGTNCRTLLADLSVEVLWGEPPAAGEPAGCGCGAAPARPAGAFALALSALLGAAARRRRPR